MDVEKVAIKRPTVRVELLGPDEDSAELKVLATTRALVDSGGDYTTFPTEWADLLKIDLKDDCEPVEVMVPDAEPAIHYMYTGGLTIRVVEETFFLDVVKFCQGLGVAYLGRKDFFDRYVVMFDHRHLRFFLERLPDPYEGEDDDPKRKLASPAE